MTNGSRALLHDEEELRYDEEEENDPLIAVALSASLQVVRVHNGRNTLAQFPLIQ